MAAPAPRAILCANDNMALGAVAAIQSAGKSGQVLVVGFDNIGAVRPMIADGRVVATADQHADQLAVFGIEAALKILKGESPPADRSEERRVGKECGLLCRSRWSP